MKTKLFTSELLQKWANSGNGHRPRLAREVIELRDKVKILENKIEEIRNELR